MKFSFDLLTLINCHDSCVTNLFACHDSIVINRCGGRKKLKQYFTDQKVPQEDRDKIWIAADGDEVLWIVGYRQSQKYQITEKTTKILEIQYYGGEENGRDN